MYTKKPTIFGHLAPIYNLPYRLAANLARSKPLLKFKGSCCCCRQSSMRLFCSPAPPAQAHSEPCKRQKRIATLQTQISLPSLRYSTCPVSFEFIELAEEANTLGSAAEELSRRKHGRSVAWFQTPPCQLPAGFF